ncbi:MAG: DUF5590 domain-containing protein [Bacillus sp. (in: firmicutes)]
MKKWIWAVSLLVLVVVGYVVASFLVGINEKKTAEEKAVDYALNEGGLKSVSEFYLYYGKEAYSVVVGKDEEGTKQVLWIPEDTKEHSIIKKAYNEGVSKTEITNIVKSNYQPKEIISVKLGMESDVPLWEVTFKDDKNHLQYYYFDFNTGEWLHNYSNI